MYRGITQNTIPGDRDRVRGLMMAGLERMRLFHRGDGLFSLWEGGSPDLHTTHKVVKNLRGLHQLPFPEALAILNDSAAALLKQGVRDNALLPLDSRFAAAMQSVEDAAALALFGPEGQRVEAVRLLREKAVVSNGTARWPGSTSWGGDLEATCQALRALRPSDPGLFAKGFRTVGSGLVEGRLYSTADTRALVELLGDLDLPPTRRVKLDGIETAINAPQVVSRAEALEGSLVVRVDEEKEIDYLAPRSDFRASLSAGKATAGLKEKVARLLGARQPVALGERITFTLQPEESTRAPLCRIFLPPGFAFLTGGANAQTTHQPIPGQALTIDAIAVRPGRGKLRAMVYDMYDAAKVGVLPELELVSG